MQGGFIINNLIEVEDLDDDSKSEDSEDLLLANIEVPEKIEFGYQAAKVKFINYFTIKNNGQKRIDWKASVNKAFELFPKNGELAIGETKQVSIIG